MRDLLPKKISDYVKKSLVYFQYPEFKLLPNVPKTDNEHLEATMRWLCLAQDATGSGGVSSSYDLRVEKWGKSYRETTGYIIETFLNYYLLTNKKEFLDRAIRMADWEISVLERDGGVSELYPNGTVVKKVFNTGQVILGLIPLFEQTRNKKYLETAVKMADFLVVNQKEDGSWEKYSTKGAKTIDTRVAWALLQVFQKTGSEKYKIAAEKNLEWALQCKNADFWFSHTGFGTNPPWTHFIVYTISGFLESYFVLKQERLYTTAYKAAEKMLQCFNNTVLPNDFLAGTFDEHWQSRDMYSCLTGDAQIAQVWMQIYQMTREKRFLDGAYKILEQVKSTQILVSKHKEIVGGILGSYPFYGEYASYLLPNWAAKFFADALIYKQKINQ